MQFVKLLCRSAKLDSFFVTGKEHTPDIAVLGPLFDSDPLPDLIGFV